MSSGSVVFAMPGALSLDHGRTVFKCDWEFVAGKNAPIQVRHFYQRLYLLNIKYTQVVMELFPKPSALDMNLTT